MNAAATGAANDYDKANGLITGVNGDADGNDGYEKTSPQSQSLRQLIAHQDEIQALIKAKEEQLAEERNDLIKAQGMPTTPSAGNDEMIEY